jgi:Tol biopolymer transport system component
MLQRPLCTLAALAVAVSLSATPASAQVTRISVATDGTQANGPSQRSTISGNGQFVVFASAASNLVTGDTNDVYDVFVRDLTGHVTTRVSVASDGTERAASSGVTGQFDVSDPLAISHDGTIVAFTSRASLVADDTNQCPGFSPRMLDPCEDIYVHDRTTGVTTRVSIATDGTQANGRSHSPSLSDDGRYVVFTSDAGNLVAGDTNGVEDVFLHDRVAHTTTRVSVNGMGAQGTKPSTDGVISGDGKVVAFIADATSFEESPSPADRHYVTVFVRTLGTGTLRRLEPVDTIYVGAPSVATTLAISTDGTRVAVLGYYTNGNGIVNQSITFRDFYDLASGMSQRVDTLAGGTGVNEPAPVPVSYGVALSGLGRMVASSGGSAGTTPGEAGLRIVDVSANLQELGGVGGLWPSFSQDGRYLTFGSTQPDQIAGDTNDAADIFLLDRDPDGDGMSSAWETQFGLNPLDPADGTADPDGDGLTSRQEFDANSHPTATQARYFAEGAANAFFHTRVAVLNPNASAAVVMLRLLGENGRTTSVTRTVGASTRETFFLGPSFPDASLAPGQTFSIVVESDRPVVSDRLMTWDATGYGSSLETSVASPGTTWYLAEGASGGPYSLYYLFQNPGDTDAQATVTYLLPAPQAPVTKTYAVPGHSRVTIDVAGEDPALKHAEVSAKITSTQPIVVERAMYMSTPGQPFAAGHDGAGIAAPDTRWFLAEGATGFFDEYVLIANAESSRSDIKVTYLLEAGQSFSETFPVAANSRYTIDVKSRDPRLAATPVSVIVESTNSVPVVVERAMWWPHGNWYEASLSAGVTGTGTKWAIAEAEQSTPVEGRSTYVLIANTDPTIDGTATVSMYLEGGHVETFTRTLPANSRTSVDLSSQFPGIGFGRFGIIVESNGVPIVVERALYQTIGDKLWAAGATSVATNITPVP